MENIVQLRQIRAAFDEQGIFVYQAFKPSIAQEALRNGTFGKGFSFERMTWIKPSFGWVLYRSGYATKPEQERILKLKLSHEGFQTILAKGVPSSFEDKFDLFPSREAWSNVLRLSEVRYQWDPDRDIRLRKLERRALQLGLSGSVVREYVSTWILGIEDVTQLAWDIKEAVEGHAERLPLVPEELVYDIPPSLLQVLGMGFDPALKATE